MVNRQADVITNRFDTEYRAREVSVKSSYLYFGVLSAQRHGEAVKVIITDLKTGLLRVADSAVMSLSQIRPEAVDIPAPWLPFRLAAMDTSARWVSSSH